MDSSVAQVEDPFVVPAGSVKIGLARPRRHVVLTGIVVRCELVGWAGGPVLEVDLRDETGVICLPFFGRRHLGGVAPGALVTAAGTVGRHGGRPVILNPQIWLRAAGARPRNVGSVDNAPMRTVDA
jgi:hypothetical protein